MMRKTINSLWVAIALTFSWSGIQSASAATLSLQEYLKQVSNQNGKFLAAAKLAKSFELREVEGRGDFNPTLTGNIYYSDSHLAPLTSLSTTQTITWGGSLGLQTKLRTGTDVSFSYSALNYNYVGSPLYYPPPFYYNSPTLTLSQPLWKDFWGAYSKANEEAQVAALKAQALVQLFTEQQILFNAEMAYWKLSLYKQIVQFDLDGIGRTERILKWNEKRVSMNVSDKADVLEAQAAVKLKQLALQSDLEIMRQTASQFNILRGVEGDQVNDSLAAMDSVIAKRISEEIKQTAVRFDVLAEQTNAEAQRARAEASLETLKPDVKLYGTGQLSGNNSNFNTALNNSWTTNYPLYTVGLKFSVSLDVDLVQRASEGHRAAVQASEYSYARSKLELAQEWTDLKKRWADVLRRLDMARELETLQKEKLDHERVRFSHGRTTSFQVLQFEGHYSEAQLTRLRMENEALLIKAQARLFNGGQQ